MSDPNSSIGIGGGRRSRKRTAVSPGDEKPRSTDDDCSCRICFQIFSEPYSTICGHTFCRECITQSLERRARCPTCSFEMDISSTERPVFPNFAVAAIADARRALNNEDKRLRGEAPSSSTGGSGGASSSSSSSGVGSSGSLASLISDADMDLSTVERLIDALQRRRQELELGSTRLKTLLLKDFLDQMINRRQRTLTQLESELRVLQEDKERVMTVLDGDPNADASHRLVPQTAESNNTDSSLIPSTSVMTSVRDAECSSVSKYRARLSVHFEGLQQAYLERRIASTADVGTNDVGVDDSRRGDLNHFSEVVHAMSQYGDFRRLATLNYNVDSGPSLSIVSSIEFDKDGEYFVVAGVTKKIKVYEYSSVIENTVGIHYPLVELQCMSKISNISWNPYTKSLLASSDYDGTVQLWDTWTGKATRKYQEHEKRCWTVQFNNVDPHLMASGSDDAKVKLWSLNSERSVAHIDAKVNVCCVYFSPTSRHNLVFGSADHCVHLYDLRNVSKAVNVFKGHRKAVSYVKYCNEREVVSASTDSHLRLWDVTTGECMRTMKGHQNEKNFVGLATDGNHIVCGSENNHLYVYYKGLADPLMSYDFTPSSSSSNLLDPCPGRSSINNETTNDFVSAVCWKKNTNVVVAANSQGTTHILELI
uniref:RING-type domain-containing protein n=1 Tax=Plectus sambesii TaxID=2011161 RepID=A0A914VHH5_9BILA